MQPRSARGSQISNGVVVLALAMTGAMTGATAAGCRAEPDTARRASRLDTYCDAVVTGVGVVPVETDYIPRVVNCENGAASQQALEAQAIAARSFLYYRLDLTGEIGDGEFDQVYTCGREPLAQHFAAAAATEGLVLQHRATQVAAFYVAGALQEQPACTGSADDPTDTEQFVTLNQGRSGDDIIQSPLGFVNPANLANRGCMSQNGADCLSDGGMQHPDILRFYYGEDIEIVRATGPCVPVSADAGPGAPNPGDDGQIPGGTSGGCAVSTGAGAPSWLVLSVAALALIRRRRHVRVS